MPKRYPPEFNSLCRRGPVRLRGNRGRGRGRTVVGRVAGVWSVWNGCSTVSRPVAEMASGRLVAAGFGVSAGLRIATGRGAAHAAILGLGVYRPVRRVSNEEISELIDSSDEWIRSRSGIGSRRFAGPDETVISMSVAAGRAALQRSGIAAGQIGCVVLATSTYLSQTPAAAPQIAHLIGANAPAAFDISAGCAGFCHALGLAADMVRGGSARYVLVIGTERLSETVDLTDRSTAFIFADGAGAVVVGPADVEGIGPVVWGSDGSQSDVIRQEPGWSEFRTDPTVGCPSCGWRGRRCFGGRRSPW